MKTSKKFTINLLILLACSLAAQAQKTTDIEGAKDYPLVTRFEGSIMQYYKLTKWDDYKLPVSEDNINRMEFKNPMLLEGKIMRWQYSTDPENNPVYILKNYEKAFKLNGYTILLKGKPNDGLENSNDFYDRFYGDWEASKLARFGFAYEPIGNHKAIIIAKTTKNDKDIYIVEVISDFSNTTMITQDIIEVEAAETGKVTVKNMSKGIASDGHIALYDILFDTGKSEIKPSSNESLKMIAEYFNSTPNTRYYIVGHTDNEGDFEANMTLSKNRANAVIDKLVSDYGVSPSQLKAFGISSLSPVSTNTTQAGKAKNRRVEIVEQ